MKVYKYYLKVTNPQKGTYHFISTLCNELCLKFEEYWQKRDDHELKLYIKPVYSTNFNHVVLLYSDKRSYIEFAKYLVKKYIQKVEELENYLIEL